MTLGEYRSNFSLTWHQFIAHHNVQPNQILEDVRYEKIIPATRVQLSSKDEYFFFRDNELMLIYISDSALTQQLWAEFKEAGNAGMPAERLRSRAGKTSNQNIFPEQGFTVSMHHDEVDFIEIYAPQSLDEYVANIYREPGLFKR